MSFSNGKVTGKNTPYLVEDDLRAIFSRNPDNYFKCKNCHRITYIQNNICMSCNKPIILIEELVSTGYVKCPICLKNWKTRYSKSCQSCRTKIMQKLSKRNGD